MRQKVHDFFNLYHIEVTIITAIVAVIGVFT